MLIKDLLCEMNDINYIEVGKRIRDDSEKNSINRRQFSNSIGIITIYFSKIKEVSAIQAFQSQQNC